LAVEHGGLYELAEAPGYEDAIGGLVLSADAVIAKFQAVTIAFVYRREPLRSTDLDLGSGLIADCWDLRSVDNRDLDDEDPWDPCTPEELDEAKRHVRDRLCIDQLLAGQPSPQPVPAPPEHYYKQGDVRYAPWPDKSDEHMFALVGSDVATVAEQRVIAAFVTSAMAAWRQPWALKAGPKSWIVAANVFTWPVGSLETKHPAPPRPEHLDVKQLEQVASLLASAHEL